MIKTIKSEYHSFICRSRMIILLAFAILVWQVVGSSLCSHAKMMEAGLQLFEPYIATANSYLVLQISLILKTGICLPYTEWERLSGSSGK